MQFVFGVFVLLILGLLIIKFERNLRDYLIDRERQKRLLERIKNMKGKRDA